MNYLNMIILIESDRMLNVPILMLLGTILGVGFLLRYFLKIDKYKNKQLEELSQKLDDLNNELDGK